MSPYAYSFYSMQMLFSCKMNKMVKKKSLLLLIYYRLLQCLFCFKKDQFMHALVELKKIDFQPFLITKIDGFFDGNLCSDAFSF